MAKSSSPVEAVLDKISRLDLKCSICRNFIREPRVLDCLHTFCLICLKKLSQGDGQGVTELPCPSCDRETLVSDLDELPHFLTLEALAEEVVVLDQLQETGQGSGVVCHACDESNEAVSRCMDCEDFLCTECQRAHARLSMINSHQICSLDELRSGKAVYKSRLREHIPKCRGHLDQNVFLYCTACQQLVCTICSVQDHTGANHSLTDPSRASEECKQKVAGKISAVELAKRRFSNAADATETPLKKLHTAFVEVSRKIGKRADEKVTKIRQEEQKLKQELQKIYQGRGKTIQSTQTTNRKEATKVEHKLEQVKSVTMQANCYELLNLSQKLLQNLKELETSLNKQKVPEKLYFVDFEEHDQSSLGRLILGDEQQSESEDKLKICIEEFGLNPTKFKCAYDVAVLSNHEIVIVDIKLQQLIVSKTLVKPPRSPPLSEAAPIPNLTDPSHVSVNKSDQLIVLDNCEVKIFNREFKLLKRFVSAGGANSKPTCLAVTDNNQIAVGFKYDEKIRLHDPDGTLIVTLQAPMIGEHLTTHTKQFIYTNHHRKVLQAVDYNGDSVFSVNLTSSIDSDWGPTGVCCDRRDGSILVALNGWSHSEVQHFSPGGKFVRRVFEGCGFPWGIVLTPECDKLVLAAHNCVTIFNRA